MSDQNGLTIVLTGDGKGKTTSALGIGLRAVGQGKRVLMVQFIKGTWKCGELEAVQKLGVSFEIKPMGRGFCDLGAEQPDPADVQAAGEAWQFVKDAAKSCKYDMIILDEINNVMAYRLLTVDEVESFIEQRPDSLDLVLTGRGAPKGIMDMADTVTEMKNVRHHYDAGVKARKGIEY